MDRISAGKSPALLVVDMQERFRSTYGDPSSEWDVPVRNINRVSDAFRAAGRPVVLLRMEGESPGHPWAGPETDVFVPELHVSPDDTVITKKHMSGFRDTPLAETLREKGCDAVVICGTITHMCVMNTYYSAYDNDFSPYILRDGTVQSREGVNEAARIVCNCVSPEHVIEYVSGNGPSD